VQREFYLSSGGEIQLDASPSFDPDGDPLTFLWRLLEKPEGSPLQLTDSTAAVITVDIPADYRGTYRFACTVTDNKDGYSVESVFVYTGIKWIFKSNNKILSSPAIGSDGTIYVGSYDNYLYAINPDGTLKWRFKTGWAVHSSPAIGSDGTIYVGSYDNYLYAINPDGTIKWRFKTGLYVISSPAIGSDGTIYVGSYDDYLYALNPDGTIKWRFQTRRDVSSSPAIGSDGTIYVGSGDDYLYALNPDGTIKWWFKTGGWIRSSPAIGSDGTIYVGSDDNYLYALNPDRTIKWRFKTGSWIRSSPAIGSDGTIYVGSHDDYLYAINPDGTLKWQFQTGGNVISSPAIGSDGTIYVGSNDGNLYALISESQGLANSPWPKFHHDSQNTGNVNSALTAIASAETEIPKRFLLFPVYPNPFNPQAHIKFSLPKTARVKIEIFNALGQKVATLLNQRKTAGVYELNWDATAFASGLYIVRMQAGSFVQTRKCLLVK